MVVKSSGVYSVTNVVNSRIYVGSSVNLYERHNAHFNSLRGGCHENRNLQSDFILFGREGFRFDVLELCGVSQLPTREKFYMDKFRVLDPTYGYNIMPEPYKGMIPEDVRRVISQKATGRKLPESAKKKIGDFNRGKIMSVETRAKMSKSQTGKKKSDACKEKCRLIHLGKKRSAATRARNSAVQNHKKKAVWCCNTIEPLVKFESIHQAARLTGITRRSISRSCDGTYAQGGGFIWRYVN